MCRALWSEKMYVFIYLLKEAEETAPMFSTVCHMVLLKPRQEHEVPLCEGILAVGDWLELLTCTMDSANCSRKSTGHKIFTLLQEPGSMRGRWYFLLCVERQKSLLLNLSIRLCHSLWYSGLQISFCWGPPVKAFGAQVFRNSKLLLLFS